MMFMQYGVLKVTVKPREIRSGQRQGSCYRTKGQGLP